MISGLLHLDASTNFEAMVSGFSGFQLAERERGLVSKRLSAAGKAPLEEREREREKRTEKKCDRTCVRLEAE